MAETLSITSGGAVPRQAHGSRASSAIPRRVLAANRKHPIGADSARWLGTEGESGFGWECWLGKRGLFSGCADPPAVEQPSPFSPLFDPRVIVATIKRQFVTKRRATGR